MKKLFSFILAAVCMLVFSGCSKERGQTEKNVYNNISDVQITEISVSQTASAVSETVTSPENEESETDSPPETTSEEPVYSEPADTVTEILYEITTVPSETEIQEPGNIIDEDGSYTSKEDVALYIHTYGKLPPNFITKKEAESLGWSGGSLEPYASGKCIGGSRFGNYEGLLPEKSGRKYTECDIDTLGAKSRGAKRIVFSNDGLIYYTGDHYETFELLYGDEE